MRELWKRSDEPTVGGVQDHVVRDLCPCRFPLSVRSARGVAAFPLPIARCRGETRVV
jgi:hypothetical protein